METLDASALDIFDMYNSKMISRKKLRKEIDYLKILRNQATKLESFLHTNEDSSAKDILRDTIDKLMTFHWYMYPTIKKKISELHEVDKEIKKLWVQSKTNPELHTAIKMITLYDH